MIIPFLMVVNSVLVAHEGTVWSCYGRKFKELLWKPDYNPSAFFFLLFPPADFEDLFDDDDLQWGQSVYHRNENCVIVLSVLK